MEGRQSAGVRAIGALLLAAALSAALLLAAKALPTPSSQAAPPAQASTGPYLQFERAIQRIAEDLQHGAITPAEAEQRIGAELTAWLGVVNQRLLQALQNDILFESRMREFTTWQSNVQALLSDPNGYETNISTQLDAVHRSAAKAWLYAVEQSDARCVRIRDWPSLVRLVELMSAAEQAAVDPALAGADYVSLRDRLLLTDPCMRLAISLAIPACVNAGQQAPLGAWVQLRFRDGVLNIPPEPVRVSVVAANALVDPPVGYTNGHGFFDFDLAATAAATTELAVLARWESLPDVVNHVELRQSIEVVEGCGSPTPTSTLTTPSATSTPTSTHTGTSTPSGTATPTNTPTPTPTDTYTPSATSTPSETPTPSSTPTPSETPTPSMTPTPSETPTPSMTPTPSPASVTPTPSPTQTHTPTITPTDTPVWTPTPPTATPTPGSVCELVSGAVSIFPAPSPQPVTYHSAGITLFWLGGSVFIGQGGCGPTHIHVDDEIVVTGPNGQFIYDFSWSCTGGRAQMPFDIAGLLVPGNNFISFDFVERCGGGSGFGDLYLWYPR